MSLNERFHIYSDVQMPCTHDREAGFYTETAADFYIDIEQLLNGKGKTSLTTTMYSDELITRLLKDVPAHKATEYLSRYFQRFDRDTVNLKAYNWAGKNVHGIAMIVPGRIQLALVDMRFTKRSTYDVLGEIRVGHGLSKAADDFDPVIPEDYAFGRTVYSVLEKDQITNG